MTKLSSMLFAAAFAATSFSATAGIAPNTGGSAMSQSGAKIATPKPAAEDQKDHQNEAKDPAK
jgi:hypothetical protein